MNWWTTVFELGSLVCLGSCFWFIVEENVRHAKHQDQAVKTLYLFAEPTALILCFYFFYLLESWASFRAPLFYYPDSALGLQWNAHDWRAVIEWLNLQPYPEGYLCYEAVHRIQPEPTIPLAIPAMEAAVTYSALRTARFLVGVVKSTTSMAHAWWVALIAALICLTIVLVLDPAVSTSSVDCGQTESYGGIGVWKWIEDESGWFGVPTWNFALWFAAPLTGGAIAYAVLWVYSWLFRKSPWHGGDLDIGCEVCDAAPPRRGKFSVFALGLLGTSLIIVVFSAHDSFHGFFNDLDSVEAFKRALILGAAAAVIASTILWSGSWRQNEPLRWTLLLPLLFFLWWPLVWHIGNESLLEVVLPAQPVPLEEGWLVPGPLADMAYAVGTGIALAMTGTYLAFSPYLAQLDKFRRTMKNINDFIRVHYFSHTSMHVYLGAGIPYSLAKAGKIDLLPSQAAVTGGELWTLFGTAVLFHIFMILLNDWKDWDLDQTQSRRANNRVIHNSLGRGWVLTIVLSTVPLAVALNYYAGGSWLWLGIMYTAMTIYDLFAKEKIVPAYVTDLIQGLAWGALVLYAVDLVVDSEAGMPLLGYVLAANAIVYILLVNGYHASIRDLANDIEHNKWTTARQLGAQVRIGGGVMISPMLRNVTFGYYVMHIMVIALLYAYVNDNLVSLISNGWVFILVGLLIWSARLMKQVLDPNVRNRDPYLSQHALVLMLAPIVVLLPAFEPAVQVITLAAFFIPFLFLDPTLSMLKNVLTGGWGQAYRGAAEKGETALRTESSDR